MNTTRQPPARWLRAMDELDVEGMMAGVEAVWNGLMAGYHRLVVHILRNRNVPEDDVDDVAQEVWLKAYRSRGTFRREEAVRSGRTAAAVVKAWIVVMSHSCAINYHRRRIHDLLVTSGLNECAVPAPDEIARLLVDWVDGLTAEEESLIRLRCAGYTYEDIAERLRRPLSTVYRAVQEVRRKLRPEL